jgi:hypothetical protein
MKTIGNVVISNREHLARTALKVFGSFNADIQLIKSLLDSDIAATTDPNIIFRGNTLGTKVMDQYMKLVGLDYLHSVLAGPIRSVIKSRDGCELDPLRVEGGNEAVLRKNLERLIKYVVIIWETVSKSAEQIPA